MDGRDGVRTGVRAVRTRIRQSRDVSHDGPRRANRNVSLYRNRSFRLRDCEPIRFRHQARRDHDPGRQRSRPQCNSGRFGRRLSRCLRRWKNGLYFPHQRPCDPRGRPHNGQWPRGRYVVGRHLAQRRHALRGSLGCRVRNSLLDSHLQYERPPLEGQFRPHSPQAPRNRRLVGPVSVSLPGVRIRRLENRQSASPKRQVLAGHPVFHRLLRGGQGHEGRIRRRYPLASITQSRGRCHAQSGFFASRSRYRDRQSHTLRGVGAGKAALLPGRHRIVQSTLPAV